MFLGLVGWLVGRQAVLIENNKKELKCLENGGEGVSGPKGIQYRAIFKHLSLFLRFYPVPREATQKMRIPPSLDIHSLAS